jgi:hypothetical protein
MSCKKSTRLRDHTEQSGFAIRLMNGRALPVQFISRIKANTNNANEAICVTRSREIDFAHLNNGQLIDLLRDGSGELVFALYQDGETILCDTIQDGNLTFIGPQIHSSFTQAVRFPLEVGASQTARQLLGEIEDVIAGYVDCEASDTRLLAYFALYSWVSDLLAVALYIWVVGPYGSGKTTILRIMSAVCRRAILVGDTSMPALYTINSALHPTLLIDEFEQGKDSKSRDLMRVLRAGSTMDQKILRASRVHDAFGPKIVASRQGPGDAALESRGLCVVARPSSSDVAVLTPSALESVALQLQPKLQAFRLNNYAKLKSANANRRLDPGLSPRLQDMARCLALAANGDTELEHEVVAILACHDKQARVERYGEPEWAVVIALLSRIHVRGPGASAFCTAKDLALDVQAASRRMGESCAPTPRKVGEILRSLGLPTQKLGSLGRGLRISPELKVRVHEIANRLGICTGDLFTPEFPDSPTTCSLCERYGLNFDNTGRKLRYERFSLVGFGPEDPENPVEDF